MAKKMPLKKSRNFCSLIISVIQGKKYYIYLTQVLLEHKCDRFVQYNTIEQI